MRLCRSDRFTSTRRTWLLGILLVGLTFVAYAPALRCGFVWDDDRLILNNPLIRRSDGLYRFWCTTQGPDYWPLTSTTWWLEWRLWGENPVGYHAVNVILHALSTLLWWRILTRLKIPGAWLAAAIFAVHPVNVESVAWIAEGKNTLAMFFFTATCLLYLSFDDTGRWRWYWTALATFALALLSKAAAAPLPLVLLGAAWWRRGRIERKDVLRSLPFFAVAALLGSVTVWFQSHRAIGDEIVRQDSFWSRLAGAGWAVWFYLYKAILPLHLRFVYPRWQIDQKDFWSYVPGLLVLMGLFVCWRSGQKWGKASLFALGYYVTMLLPVLGFINIYFMRYSLVTDHWQYFSIIGLIALVVSGGVRTARHLGGRGYDYARIVGAVVLVGLTMTTWEQVRAYENVETLWRDTLTKNPGCWMAYCNLGNTLLASDEVPEAIEQYQEAIQINPDYVKARNNLGNALVRLGKMPEAIEQYQRAIQINPSFAMAHMNLGNALVLEGKTSEAIGPYEQALRLKPDSPQAQYNLGYALEQTGRIREAMARYEQAIRIWPDFVEPQNKLAWLLATVAPADGADPIRALELAQRACALAGNPPAGYLDTLAAAYAAAGQFSEAIGVAEKAVEEARVDNQPKLAEEIEARLELYRGGHAYRLPAQATSPPNP